LPDDFEWVHEPLKHRPRKGIAPTPNEVDVITATAKACYVARVDLATSKELPTQQEQATLITALSDTKWSVPAKEEIDAIALAHRAPEPPTREEIAKIVDRIRNPLTEEELAAEQKALEKARRNKLKADMGLVTAVKVVSAVSKLKPKKSLKSSDIGGSFDEPGSPAPNASAAGDSAEPRSPGAAPAAASGLGPSNGTIAEADEAQNPEGWGGGGL